LFKISVSGIIVLLSGYSGCGVKQQEARDRAIAMVIMIYFNISSAVFAMVY